MNLLDELNLDVLVQDGMGAAGPMSVGVTSTPGTPEAAGTTRVAAGGTGVAKGNGTIPSFKSRKKRKRR